MWWGTVDIVDTLIGTGIGGLITVLVAWGTFRSESARQRRERRRQHLEELAVEVHRTAGEHGMALSMNQFDTAQGQRLLFLSTLLMARANDQAPHLASLVESFVDRLFNDQLGAVKKAATPATPEQDHGRELRLELVQWQPVATAAWALSGATLDWVRDPEAFERRARPASWYLSTVEEEGLHNLLTPAGEILGL
jgi:hypothetical protein